MAAVTHVYEDRWGGIIDHADAGYVEIRWYDTTSAMSAGEFQQWLANFAAEVERRRRPSILVDATRFLFDPSTTSAEWWYTNIVPRYNSAGVKRFAFHVPEGMPEVGSPPDNQAPAAFLTAYFDRRQAALEWLAAAMPPTAR